MSQNLFKRVLSKEETKLVADILENDSNFHYSIMEGGYISSDCQVIFIDNRNPYIGMLLPYGPDFSDKIGDSWKSYFRQIGLHDI